MVETLAFNRATIFGILGTFVGFVDSQYYLSNVDSGNIWVSNYNTAYETTIELDRNQVTNYSQYYSNINVYCWVWVNGEGNSSTGWLRSWSSCIYPKGTPISKAHTVAEAYTGLSNIGATVTDEGSLTVALNDAEWVEAYARIAGNHPGTCTGWGRVIFRVWLS